MDQQIFLKKQKQIEEFGLPCDPNQKQTVVMQIKTNFVGNTDISFDLFKAGNFLRVPQGFPELCANTGLNDKEIEEQQKLCKDPITGRLYLCSNVSTEALVYELMTCSRQNSQDF